MGLRSGPGLPGPGGGPSRTTRTAAPDGSSTENPGPLTQGRPASFPRHFPERLTALSYRCANGCEREQSTSRQPPAPALSRRTPGGKYEFHPTPFHAAIRNPFETQRRGIEFRRARKGPTALHPDTASTLPDHPRNPAQRQPINSRSNTTEPRRAGRAAARTTARARQRSTAPADAGGPPRPADRRHPVQHTHPPPSRPHDTRSDRQCSPTLHPTATPRCTPARGVGLADSRETGSVLQSPVPPAQPPPCRCSSPPSTAPAQHVRSRPWPSARLSSAGRPQLRPAAHAASTDQPEPGQTPLHPVRTPTRWCTSRSAPACPEPAASRSLPTPRRSLRTPLGRPAPTAPCTPQADAAPQTAPLPTPPTTTMQPSPTHPPAIPPRTQPSPELSRQHQHSLPNVLHRRPPSGLTATQPPSDGHSGGHGLDSDPDGAGPGTAGPGRRPTGRSGTTRRPTRTATRTEAGAQPRGTTSGRRPDSGRRAEAQQGRHSQRAIGVGTGRGTHCPASAA